MHCVPQNLMIIFSTGLEDFIDKFIAENKSIEVCPFCAFDYFTFDCKSDWEIIEFE